MQLIVEGIELLENFVLALFELFEQLAWLEIGYLRSGGRRHGQSEVMGACATGSGGHARKRLSRGTQQRLSGSVGFRQFGSRRPIATVRQVRKAVPFAVPPTVTTRMSRSRSGLNDQVTTSRVACRRVFVSRSGVSASQSDKRSPIIARVKAEEPHHRNTLLARSNRRFALARRWREG